MVSPLQNLLYALEPDADHLRASQAPNRNYAHAIADLPGEAAGDDDLQRLERSLQWVKRERMIAAFEAGLHAQNQRRRLPRAGRLAPVSEIPPVNPEPTRRNRETLTFQVAPPLASERLQLPIMRRQRAYNLPGALCLLIAGAVAASIAYHVSAEGSSFSTSQPAEAASLQTE
jgi:hypothetical protein